MDKHEEYSRAVIAGVMDFPALIDEPEISALLPSDFHGAYGKIWGEATALYRDGGLTTVKLVERLPPGFDLAYFAQLRMEHVTMPTDDLLEYANALRRHSGRREMVDIASKLATAAHGETEPAQVAAWAMDALAKWAMNGATSEMSLSDVLSEVYDDVSKRYANPGEVWGVPYGWPKIDKYTGGLQPGEMLIVSGEPGVGKTWWATQLALQASKTCPGVFLSLEMKKKAITRRMLSIFGADRRKMNTGHMEIDDWQNLDAAMSSLKELPIVIDDRPIKLHELRPILARQKTKRNIQWFVLDYLYLIDAPGMNEIEQTQNISREIKQICLALDLAGIIIHSVNKSGMDSGESGKAKLRGSGQVIHDADMIYVLTKFKAVQGDAFDSSIMPADQPKIVTLHIEKGRELEQGAGGVIHYRRRDGSPGFDELDNDVSTVKRIQL